MGKDPWADVHQLRWPYGVTREDPGRDYFRIENNRHEGLGTQKINEQKRKAVRTGRSRLED